MAHKGDVAGAFVENLPANCAGCERMRTGTCGLAATFMAESGAKIAELGAALEARAARNHGAAAIPAPGSSSGRS